MERWDDRIQRQDPPNHARTGGEQTMEAGRFDVATSRSEGGGRYPVPAGRSVTVGSPRITVLWMSRAAS